VSNHSNDFPVPDWPRLKRLAVLPVSSKEMHY
jgi:hypothetical protein